MEAGSGFPPSRLRVRHDVDQSGRVHVILVGEVDMSSVGAVAEAVAVVPEGADVVIDLAGVTFLDSTGVAALIVAHRRTVAGGQTLTVVNASGIVHRALDITGTLPTLGGTNTAGQV